MCPPAPHPPPPQPTHSTPPPLKQLCCFGPALKAVLITGTEHRSEWQAGSILLKPNERNLCRVRGPPWPEEPVSLSIVLLLLASPFCPPRHHQTTPFYPFHSDSIMCLSPLPSANLVPLSSPLPRTCLLSCPSFDLSSLKKTNSTLSCLFFNYYFYASSKSLKRKKPCRQSLFFLSAPVLFGLESNRA